MGVSIDALDAMTGQKTGTSEWLTVDQTMINGFADVTGDHQFIHVNEEKAKQTPFGGTIAHGFLTLSLLANLGQETGVDVDGVQMAVNYGVDTVRFLTPVRAGKRIRLHSTLKAVANKGGGRVLLTMAQEIEIEGEDKPALVADSLVLMFTQ